MRVISCVFDSNKFEIFYKSWWFNLKVPVFVQQQTEVEFKFNFEPTTFMNLLLRMNCLSENCNGISDHAAIEIPRGRGNIPPMGGCDGAGRGVGPRPLCHPHLHHHLRSKAAAGYKL